MMLSNAIGRMTLQSSMGSSQLLLNPDITEAANVRNRS